MRFVYVMDPMERALAGQGHDFRVPSRRPVARPRALHCQFADLYVMDGDVYRHAYARSTVAKSAPFYTYGAPRRRAPLRTSRRSSFARTRRSTRAYLYAHAACSSACADAPCS